MNERTLDGKYRLIRRVGSGGMGAVYVAERLDGGGLVAIKRISSTEHASNPAVVERFHREARAAARIDSPHIARVLDTGSDQRSGAPYMAMELLDGYDLHRFTKQVGPLDPDLAMRISAQACLGLAQAHEANVIHRDIKSANIFLSRVGDGTILVKLLDFGIAKTPLGSPTDPESTGLTRTGMLLGSPLFMSPEQTRGTKRVDQRSDLWSLGMVMFRMLAGRAPYEHIRAVGELIFAICSAPPPLVQNLAPWVPPEVAGILERAMRIDPDERYQSAREMLAAIRAQLPEGHRITEDMLIGISAERRMVVAPRFDGGEPMPAPELPALHSNNESSGGGSGSGSLQASGSRAPAPRGNAWHSGPGLSPPPDAPASALPHGGPASSSPRSLPSSGIPHGGPVSSDPQGGVPANVPGAARSPGAAGAPNVANIPLRAAPRGGEPIVIRSDASATLAPSGGAAPLPLHGLPSARSANVFEHDLGGSTSLLDIPAFRPSRKRVFLVGGVIVALIVVGLIQLDESLSPDAAAPSAAQPAPAVERLPTMEQPTTAAPHAPSGASSAERAGGAPYGLPGGSSRPIGFRGSPATRPGSAAGAPRVPTTQPADRAAPSPSTVAPPLDPNGFGGRK